MTAMVDMARRRDVWMCQGPSADLSMAELHFMCVDALRKWLEHSDWRARDVEGLKDVVRLVYRRGLILQKVGGIIFWDPVVLAPKTPWRVSLTGCLNVHERLTRAPRKAVVAFLIMWRFRRQEMPSLGRLPRDVIKTIVSHVLEPSHETARLWWDSGRPDAGEGFSILKCVKCCTPVSRRHGLHCVMCQSAVHDSCCSKELRKPMGDMFVCRRCRAIF